MYGAAGYVIDVPGALRAIKLASMDSMLLVRVGGGWRGVVVAAPLRDDAVCWCSIRLCTARCTAASCGCC